MVSGQVSPLDRVLSEERLSGKAFVLRETLRGHLSRGRMSWGALVGGGISKKTVG